MIPIRPGMRRPTDVSFSLAGILLLATAVWVVVGASSWIDRPFAGFLVLENSVVASAGLTSWPATSAGNIFQHQVVSYDEIPFASSIELRAYVEAQPIGRDIFYVFERGESRIELAVATRLFTFMDALLLWGATLLCAIAFLGVAVALLYMAPKDPASLGTALSFGITGCFALTALDLYGPYHFFRVHAVAECFLGAGMFHMALAFPDRRRILDRLPWLVPSAYLGATALGLITGFFLYRPEVYVQTHRLAILMAGLSFLAVVLSQIAAYVKPRNYAARKRVEILALGTFASVTPAFLLFFLSASFDGGASENLAGWTGAFFPVSVAYAVLRADALQVDSIVRRTVSYALLTIIVGAAYAGLIGGLEFFVRDQGDAPRWISIVVFAGFCTFGVLPLRDVLQSSVDKLFFRAAYDFRVTIEETSAVLARLTALSEIRTRIEDTVTEALQPESVELVVDVQASEDDTLSPEQDPVMDLDSGGIVIQFRSSNRVVAHLLLGRRLSGRFYSGEDKALLQILANQGAISIENALALESLSDLNMTLEKRVRDRTAELAQTVEELTETQVQLVQAERLAAVGELAAGVAHEVNNPLNFARNSLRTLAVLVDELSSYAEAVGEIDLNDAEMLVTRGREIQKQFDGLDAVELAGDVKELVEILGSGLDRTARLVTDLRDFAAPQSEEKLPFSLSETVRATLQLTGSSMREAGIHVESNDDKCFGLAFGDSSSMNQVLLNVMKNSMDALEGRSDGVIRVMISEELEAQNFKIVIEDNGPGIPDEIASKIFDPFFTTKDAGKGTGLGLAMCQRLMQDYGGMIRFDLSFREGTRAIIELPAAPAN